MTDEPDESRIAGRAHLLPEERRAGSDDPHLQAKTILEDSDDRVENPERTRQESTQTPD